VTAHQHQPPPAGTRVNLALAAALAGGIRPMAITVELTSDGAPSGLIIDAQWGTSVKDTHAVYQALGITEPVLATLPEPDGRTRVDVDDSDPATDAVARIGIPVSITVDAPTNTAEHAFDPDTASQGAAGHGAASKREADVVDLAAFRARHHATEAHATADHTGDQVAVSAPTAHEATDDAGDDAWGS